MKKHLLTSTALVAAGAAAFTAGSAALSGVALAQKKAAKPTLSIQYRAEQIMGFSDNDNRAAYSGSGSGFDQQTDSEIHFNGAVNLDNGITIRTRAELEGNTSTDQIDEHWMRIGGSFGLVTLGSQDGAAQQMVTGYQGSWSAGVGQNLSFDVADWIEPPDGHAASSVQRVTVDGDAEKVTYYTPRFAGFQFGASFVPEDDDDRNTGPPDRDNKNHEGIQIAVNYVNKFGDVGIGAAAGYAEIKKASSHQDDKEVYGFGLRVDFGGFRIGGGYVNTDDDAATAAGGATQNDVDAFDLGARYTFGPNAVSVTYQNVEQDQGITGVTDESTDQAMVSFRRTLGPGVNWTLNGMWADYEGRTTGNSDDNDGYAITTSIKVVF